MNLDVECLLDGKVEWQGRDFKLPEYDIRVVRKKTYENPVWVHFGAGNIFRAFPAAVCQDLLNRSITDRGIIVAEGYDFEIIEKVFDENDNLTISVTLNNDGSVSKEVIASVTEALTLDFNNARDTKRLKEVFASDSLKIASFTITEKGYSLRGGDGKLYPEVISDFENRFEAPKTYMGRLTALLYHRFINGAKPITMISMDNCSRNGEKLRAAVTEFAEHWGNDEFLEYIQNKVTYPCTMIDKITPRPSEKVLEILKEDGVRNISIYETEKHSFVAPFVNAEAPQYLVIEDIGERLPLDEGGIIYTDLETVDKTEKMKVCTCLNPLHTCLAVFGCLLGYDKISDEMQDEQLVALINGVGYTEGLPVVVDPKIISPKEFIDEVINTRLPNPFIPDMPQRIACDTSQKLAIRFGETIKAYQGEGRTGELKYIPLTLAGWCRYIMGIDDNGNKFEPSSDPLLKHVQNIMDGIELGCTDKEKIHSVLKELLSNERIFGLNLYETELANRIEEYFAKLNSGAGAVRQTLKEIVVC